MYLQPNFVASDFPAEIKIHFRVAEINDLDLDFFFVLCKLMIYEISTFMGRIINLNLFSEIQLVFHIDFLLHCSILCTYE